MREAVEYSQQRPVLIDHFLEDAIEVDVDALCDGEDVVIAGIMQHIEEAGIHSGDSSCVMPSVDLSEQVLATIRSHTFKLARALNVVGLVNIQFAVQREKRLRYRSQSAGVTHGSVCLEGHRHSAGQDCRALDDGPQAAGISGRAVDRESVLDTGAHYFVKSPVFPWNKFPGVDTVLGPEMKSTGEVMGVADSFGEAFAKAQLSAGQKLPGEGNCFLERQRP